MIGFYVALALGGLLVGSFLNVVIVRMPAEEPVVRGRSRCPHCEAPIALRDNIPVVSWAILRGSCRECSESIPAGYPLVELANMALWLAAGARFGPHVVLVPYLFLFSVLLAQSVIDLELYLLLDRITFPAIGVSIPLLGLAALTVGNPRGAMLGALVGGVGYFVFLFTPAFINPKGLGLGDVKLVGLMGLYLGFIHPILVLHAAIIGMLAGVVVGGVLYFVRGRKSAEIPFGPWLSLGCIAAIMLHTSLVAS